MSLPTSVYCIRNTCFSHLSSRWNKW